MPIQALPYSIQCAELASARAAAVVKTELERRVTSVASIAATATLLGFLGTIGGMANAFKSTGGSESEGMIAIARALSSSMTPGAIGIAVAIVAFCFYRHLLAQLETFELERKNAKSDLVNRLIVHLARLKTTDPAP